jgi:hypothetical protein
MEKGIAPIPQSGLGNQIFIVVAGFVLSMYHNCPLYLFNNTNCGNWHSKKEYKHSIFKFIGTHIDSCFMVLKNGSFGDYKKHYLSIFQSFDKWNLDSAPPGTYLESYYQYYPPFEKYENIIREKLLLGLESYRNTLKEKYDFGHCGFLHVRRGDYLHFSDRHYIQPISYYRYCINELLKQKPEIKKIYVLSDDLEWISNCSLFVDEFKHICEIYDNEDEIESLSFMTLCDEGSICANSTFSWWGAFLGAFEKRNPVFYPDKWMKSDTEINLFPKEWIKVSEFV